MTLSRTLRRTAGAGLLAALVALPASAGLLDDMGIDSDASQKVKEQQYYPEKQAPKPAQHSGGEGLPPLPLPVVPQRRTEKKAPPRSPVLIGKLANSDRIDWATSPEDINNLLRWMSKEMNVNFSATNVGENQIPADARDIPVLYRSGIKAFSYTPEQRARLRNYVLSGGTIIFNAYCGHPDFARSAIIEMQQILPERSPYRLSLDHPLYHSYYDISEIKYRPLALEAKAQQNVPSTIGIDINTRTAIFFFRYDVSTAWDGLPADRKHIIGHVEDRLDGLGIGDDIDVAGRQRAGEGRTIAEGDRTVVVAFDRDSAQVDGLVGVVVDLHGLVVARTLDVLREEDLGLGSGGTGEGHDGQER